MSDGSGKAQTTGRKTAVWVVDMRKVAHAMIDARSMQRYTLGDRLKLASLAQVSGVSYPTMQRAAKGRRVERSVVERLAVALDLRIADFAYETNEQGHPVLPGFHTPPAAEPPAPPPPPEVDAQPPVAATTPSTPAQPETKAAA